MSIQEKFIKLCINRRLEDAKILLQNNPNINISYGNEIVFRLACYKGDLEMAKWLLEVKPDIDMFAGTRHVFYTACFAGQLEIAKWLLELNLENISNEYKDSFCAACYNGHLDIAKWLQSLVPSLFVIYYNNDGSYKNFYIRNEEEQTKYILWEKRKIPLWLASRNSPNKKSLIYKIPTDISRLIIEKFL